MRKLFAFLTGIALLVVTGSRISGSEPEDPFRLKAGDHNSDPLTGRKYSAALKVSTLQVLFSEAPFTAEIFVKNGFSHQFQAGIIFPMKAGSFLQEFFESSGRDGMASESGFISYRNSPFNTHGMSFKYELRKYGRKFYFAPQIMYKYNYYDDEIFRISIAGKPYDRMESKHSRVFGIGIMAGRQTYFMKQATDWYIGIGVRRRISGTTVTSLTYAGYPDNVVYPDKEVHRNSVYPFINFGFRTGFVL